MLVCFFALLSDEITTPFAKEPNSIKLMKGEQTTDNPLMGFGVAMELLEEVKVHYGKALEVAIC